MATKVGKRLTGKADPDREVRAPNEDPFWSGSVPTYPHILKALPTTCAAVPVLSSQWRERFSGADGSIASCSAHYPDTRHLFLMDSLRTRLARGTGVEARVLKPTIYPMNLFVNPALPSVKWVDSHPTGVL